MASTVRFKSVDFLVERRGRYSREDIAAQMRTSREVKAISSKTIQRAEEGAWIRAAWALDLAKHLKISNDQLEWQQTGGDDASTSVATGNHATKADDDNRHFYRFWRPAMGGTKLEIPGLRVDDRWLGLLAGRRECASLRKLGLANTRITDVGMPHLNAAINLRSLALDYTRITNTGLAQLRELSRLQCLFLAGTDLDGEDGIRSIERLTSLQQLSLSNTTIGPSAIQYLSTFKNIQRLWLDRLDFGDGSGLSADDLEPILELKSLQHLALTGSKITDEGVRLIATNIPALNELYLEDTGISDDAIEHLLRYKDTLQSISLNYNSHITDDGVAKFISFRRLCRLQISGTRISHKSIYQLAGLNLAQLCIENTAITDRHIVQQLHSMFPGADIRV